jgi:hypothetical protein
LRSPGRGGHAIELLLILLTLLTLLLVALLLLLKNKHTGVYYLRSRAAVDAIKFTVLHSALKEPATITLSACY